MRMEGWPLHPSPDPKLYRSKKIQSKRCTIKFMRDIFLYSQLPGFCHLFLSESLCHFSWRAQILACPSDIAGTKQHSPGSRNYFQKYHKNNIYTHKYKYRHVSGISNSENGSLSWMEVTETKERNKIDSAIPY